MGKRRTIKVKGEEKPVMTLSITNTYYPKHAPKLKLPPHPPELKSKEEIGKWLGNAIGELEDKGREV